ncbi:hypothetical protein ABIB06_000546 [Bradyrhizobium sp. LB8.2]
MLDLDQGCGRDARDTCPLSRGGLQDPDNGRIGQERTSKIMLNGVSVARRKRLKPASVVT